MNASSGDAYTWSNRQNATTEAQVHSEAGCGAVCRRQNARLVQLWPQERRE